MFCFDPEGWHAGWGEGGQRGEVYVYIQLIHFSVQHKHDIVEQLGPPPPPPKKGKSQSEECPWMLPFLIEASWLQGASGGRAPKASLLILQGLPESFPPLMLHLVMPDYVRSPDVAPGNPTLSCKCSLRVSPLGTESSL